MTDASTTVERLTEGARAPSVSDFAMLLKPRVMSLVVFTAWVGMAMAPGAIHPAIGMIAILAIAVGAGASGALNMWFDADIDARMRRTQSRPVPSGRVAPNDALAFGVILSLFSVTLLGLATNLVAALLLAGTIFFYAVVYTMWLKRWTDQNIVIGGAAGALPPVIGWAAVTGGVSIEPLILFAIIFMWTPPHFWALSLAKCEDYASAGVPMLPVVKGARATQNQILAYSLLLAPLGALPALMGFAGTFSLVIAAISGLAFAFLAWRLWRMPSDAPTIKGEGMRLFGWSILYLFVVFASFLAERLAGWTPA